MTPDPATGPAPPSADPSDTRPLRPPGPSTHTYDPVLLTADAPAVPGYDVLEEIGRGGMGVVYKARQVTLNRVVALKVVAGTDPKGLIRFLAEAEAAAAVDHPHVVRVFESGEAAGRPFLVMEYLPGGNLGDRLRAGRLTPRDAAGLAAKLARGVQAAHDQGIVHRDLKPANVLFDESGEPKVSDFGLAKRQGGSDLTKTLAIMGTPAYMAPEQAAGRSKYVGPPADVWALGVILYESLTGARPFADEDPWEILRQIRDEDPLPPQEVVPAVPRDLDLVCLKCLAKDPVDRYPTATALADDLGRFLAGETVSVRTAGWVERGYRWARRRPYQVAVGLLAGLAVFLGGFGGAAGWLWMKADAARHAAESERAVAKTERQRAEAARDGEAAARDELAGVSAARSVDLAHREWLTGNTRRAADLLADCPPSLRNWEWQYVNRLCNSHLRVIDNEPATRVSYSSDGRWLTNSRGVVVTVRDARPPVVGPSVLGTDGAAVVWDKRDQVVGGSMPVAAMGIAGTESTRAGPRTVLAVPGRGSVPTIWDPVTRRQLFQLTPTGRIKGANDLTTGGGLAATWLSRFGPIDVWDLASGSLRFATTPDPNERPRHAAETVHGVALTPDGARMVVFEHGGKARVWDTAAGRVVATFPIGTEYQSVRYEPNPVFGRSGTMLAANTADGVGVWEVATGRRVAALPLPPRTTNGLAFSADGRRLAVLRDGLVHLWDAETFRSLFTLRVGTQSGVALSSDGRRLFTVGGGGLREWDATGEQATLTYRPTVGRITAARFTPDGPVVVRLEARRTVLRNLATGAETAFADPTTNTIRGHLLSPDGRRLVRTAGANGDESALIDSTTGRVLCAFETRELRSPPTFGSVAFSTDGSQVFSIDPDGTVTTRDAVSGTPRATARSPYRPLEDPRDPPTSPTHLIAIGPVGPIAVSGRFRDRAMVWNAETGVTVCDLQPDPKRGVAQYSAVRFTPDGRLAGADGGWITLYDPGTGRRLAPPVFGQPPVAFTPDGTRMATAAQLAVQHPPADLNPDLQIGEHSGLLPSGGGSRA